MSKKITSIKNHIQIVYDIESVVNDSTTGFHEAVALCSLKFCDTCADIVLSEPGGVDYECNVCMGGGSKRTFFYNANEDETNVDNNNVCRQFLQYILGIEKTLISCKTKSFQINCVAHNGRNYDSHFILKCLMNNFAAIIRDKKIIMTGNKIIKLPVSSNIVFLDSLNHLTGSLASLPKSYNIENLVAKGFFPYKYVTIKNLNYVGEIPNEDYFCVSGMNDKRLNVFYKWYADMKDKQYNLKDEMIKYCRNDVFILSVCMNKYKTSMFNQFQINIFDFTTKASLSHGIWRRDYLPEKTVLLINKKRQKNYSNECIVWLKVQEKKYNVSIQGGDSFFGERRLVKPLSNVRKSFFIDGYDRVNNTCYFFHGCFFHGCLKCYNLGKIKSFVGGISQIHLYNDIKTYINEVKKTCNVREIWECDWNEMLKNDMLLKTIRDRLYFQIKNVGRLQPEQAIYGGEN